MRRILLVFAFLSPFTAGAEPECSLQQIAIDAALGNPEAQYNLAVEFWRGESVARDPSKSAVLWRLASDQGDLDAKSNLGFLLFNGHGVERDEAEALRLWSVAAAGGQSEANLHLSRAYSPNDGSQGDLLEAYARALAAKAIASGSNRPTFEKIAMDAQRQLDLLRPKLSKAQIEEAKRRGEGYAGR